jgi:hypothetical protein
LQPLVLKWSVRYHHLSLLALIPDDQKESVALELRAMQVRSNLVLKLYTFPMRSPNKLNPSPQAFFAFPHLLALSLSLPPPAPPHYLPKPYHHPRLSLKTTFSMKSQFPLPKAAFYPEF